MPKMKNIAVLGSTGSIGTQTLDVIRRFPDEFRPFALSAGRNIDLFMQQIKDFSPEMVCVLHHDDARTIKALFPKTKVLSGSEGIYEIASHEKIDIVINAIVGSAGLLPSYAAIAAGKRLCTANKESLVMAGEILTTMAKSKNAEIFPIDSEHSALWQAMLSGHRTEVKRLILTASGGPFWDKEIDFEKVTPEQAINHPNWSMGAKISIDSATMMNKALEIIEARWLFDIPPDKIEVLIHPQSIVHSIVEFIDGSQIAQMSIPDMRLPIQYALTYPKRFDSSVVRLDLSKAGKLEFFEPNHEKFPAIMLGYKALQLGGTAPTILNAANEVAVMAFIQGEIGFHHIIRTVQDTIASLPLSPADSIEKILYKDSEARDFSKKLLRSLNSQRKSHA